MTPTPERAPAAEFDRAERDRVAIDGATPAEAMRGPARWTVIGLTVAALALVVNQLFNLQAFGIVLIDNRYLYILGGLFLATAFLVFQLRGGKGGTPSILDWALFAATLGCTAYLSQTAQANLSQGWEYAAPETAQWVALAFYLLVLEGTRRAGGLVLFAIVLFFSLYPTFAGLVPDPFSGFQSTFFQTVPYHIYSAESSFGIPMKAFGGVVIGFILFGAVLQRTGGGQFFNDLALGMVGGYRGGAAKVSIFASGFMGSMSGSVISNVLTTGAVSIPAMRKHWVLRQDRRRHGGLRLDGRGPDAAHHGGHGLRHGLVPVAPLRGHRARGGDPVAPLLLGPLRADRRLLRAARAARDPPAGPAGAAPGAGRGLALRLRLRAAPLHDGRAAARDLGAVLLGAPAAGGEPVPRLAPARPGAASAT